VLCLASLMVFQIWSSVVVQPSWVVLPHIPWLSGVADPQVKAVVGGVAGASGIVGVSGVETPGGTESCGSVAQPRASRRRGAAATWTLRRVLRHPAGLLMMPNAIEAPEEFRERSHFSKTWAC
jgi:hypothetical protein